MWYITKQFYIICMPTYARYLCFKLSFFNSNCILIYISYTFASCVGYCFTSKSSISFRLPNNLNSSSQPMANTTTIPLHFLALFELDPLHIQPARLNLNAFLTPSKTTEKGLFIHLSVPTFQDLSELIICDHCQQRIVPTPTMA